VHQGEHVFYVGIDLAWGERKPTGYAILDEHGRLVCLGAARTDEEIEAALADYVRGDCVVAIDAPLVVTNPTGNRPAEAALNRDFARFQAGAHPSNTAKPEFAGVPRAARLADRLGLDFDPASARERRAIEVYPHPATIALFGLPVTLKYKDKPGRTVQGLRSELLRLLGYLEGLRDAQPPLLLSESALWRDLAGKVGAATRKSELRVAEDQVDAVVCAYVAAYAHQRPGDVTTYGDYREGYIVTPTLAARPLTPSAAIASTDTSRPDTSSPERSGPERSSPERSSPENAIAAYARRRPRLVDAGERFTNTVTRMLDDAGINYLTVDGRTKSIESFAAKAHRAVDGVPIYADPLAEITDQIGVRVITYLLSDVQAVADLLSDQLVLISDRDMGQETASEGRFGYASRHLLIALDEPSGGRAGEDQPAQVQIRTVLQHAWAEFEHDIRYKGNVPEEHAPDLDRRFTLAAGLLELADREFSTIRDRLQADMRADQASRAVVEEDDDPRIAAPELASFLAGQYADAGWSRTDHYAWISGLLLELGITSLEELRGVLNRGDEETVLAAMGYRYPPGAVRRLDDALLAQYAEAYVNLTGNEDRRELLSQRLVKLTGSDLN
jgi:predicted RNase H-like nuclease/ppGpp synthetase/RelA/SpoT-type nucleotidyltranferase